MKKKSLFLIQIVSLCLFSCEISPYDSFSDSLNKTSVPTPLVDTLHYFSDNLIPDWVKDSLSPESLKWIKELSKQYKIKYRVLTKEEQNNSSTSLSKDKLFIPSSKRTNSNDNHINFSLRLKTSSEGGDLDVGDTYTGKIETVESWFHGPAQIEVKAYYSCSINRTKQEIKDVNLTVDLVATGLVAGSKRWVDGGSRADKSGSRIEYIIIGTAEVSTTVEGIGIDLSRDVHHTGSTSPFSW